MACSDVHGHLVENTLLLQALKDAQAAKAEAEQDADVIQQQLQQAQAASISKPEALDPPSTPPAPRRTLSGKRASANGLQVSSPNRHASAERYYAQRQPADGLVFCCEMLACSSHIAAYNWDGKDLLQRSCFTSQH